MLGGQTYKFSFWTSTSQQNLLISQKNAYLQLVPLYNLIRDICLSPQWKTDLLAINRLFQVCHYQRVVVYLFCQLSWIFLLFSSNAQSLTCSFYPRSCKQLSGFLSFVFLFTTVYFNSTLPLYLLSFYNVLLILLLYSLKCKSLSRPISFNKELLSIKVE